MFKAFGKWGAQVKSRIRIPFLSSFFGSKSTNYAGIDDDQEEIFSDAKEDLSDTEEELIVAKNTGNGHVSTSNDTQTIIQGSNSDSPNLDVELDTGISRTSNEQLADLSVHKADDTGSSQSESNEEEHSDNDHDDHHDTHDDKKKIIRTESKTNGMTKSPSTSTFKKVHRRISSLTQKTYSKLDNNANDDVDHLVHHETDDHVIESTEMSEDNRREKKPSRRKKVAKRARRSLRGSWKFMKRGMMGYARAFSSPTFFVINFSGAAATRKY